MNTVGKVSNASVLKRAIRSDNPKPLLQDWALRPFYALFTLDEHGQERGACVRWGRDLAVLVTLEKTEAESLIESLVSSDSSQEINIKSVPLWELARFAYSQHMILAWAKEDLVFPREALELVGYKAFVCDADGAETLVKVQVVPLDSGGESSLVSGDLQWWTRDSGAESTERVLIYNDSLRWKDNSVLPALPDNARPLSFLSPEERVVYDRWARPSLPLEFGDVETIDADVDVQLPPNEWLGEDCLEGPRKICHLMGQLVFPNARNFKLEVKHDKLALDDDQSDAESSMKVIRLTFLYLEQNSLDDRITPLSIAQEKLTLDELNALPFRLPTAPGMHPMPENLLGMLRRRLAWGLFSASRQLDGGASLLDGLLRSLLVAFPDNADERFTCDPDDRTFPFLAAFRCDHKRVPVMVLGNQDGNLVCNPLVDLNVPEAQVPETLPLRDDLIVDGTMTLWALSGSVLIPEQLIECPQGWYRGARVSARHAVLNMSNNLHLINYVMADDAPEPDELKESGGKDLLKWMGGIAVIFVFVVMLMEA